MKLPIASMSTTFLDWPSPDGYACILFIAGCTHRCPGCQSPALQDPDAGRWCEVDADLAGFIVDYCRRSRTSDVVLSGGDPLCHAEAVQLLMDLMREREPKVRFCIYTGFDHAEASRLVHGYDFIKCGRFVREAARPSSKDDAKMVLASPNQEVWDGHGRLLSRDGVLRFGRKAYRDSIERKP